MRVKLQWKVFTHKELSFISIWYYRTIISLDIFSTVIKKCRYQMDKRSAIVIGAGIAG